MRIMRLMVMLTIVGACVVAVAEVVRAAPPVHECGVRDGGDPPWARHHSTQGQCVSSELQNLVRWHSALNRLRLGLPTRGDDDGGIAGPPRNLVPGPT